MPLALRTLTLGCKVNQYETEFVRQGLIDAGHYRDAAEDESADLCIINTCTVTNEDPPGFGFGEATLRISRFFRIAPATRDGVPTSGGRFRTTVRWQLPEQ